MGRLMKLAVVAGVFAPGRLDEVLDRVVGHGFEAVEFPTGNYGGTPCFDLNTVLTDKGAVRPLRAAVERRRLTISALSCQGNPLHPQEEIAGRHHAVMLQTFRLAAELGVEVVNVFSGCPGAGDGSRYPYWVACAWPRVCRPDNDRRRPVRARVQLRIARLRAGTARRPWWTPSSRDSLPSRAGGCPRWDR